MLPRPLITGARRAAVALAMSGAATAAARPLAAQVLETEDARLLPRGTWEVGSAYEFQRSADGREHAVPLVLEYGIRDRLELMIEPVPFTRIQPRGSRAVTGAGDLEVTTSWRFADERGTRPALALAAEVKVPTAHDALIGTGVTDYTAYLIASRRLGNFDVHANLGYSVLGQPAGASLRNTVNGALAAIYHAGRHTELFAEALGVTAAAPEGENGDAVGPASPVPEAAGAELVGTVGLGRYVLRSVLLYGGVSYDNNAATQLRGGVTIFLHPR